MYKSQQRSFPSFIGFLLFSTRLSPSLKPLQINLSLCDDEEARILGGLGGGGLRYRRLRFLLELHLQLQLSVLSPGKSGSWMLCRFSLQQGMVPAEISFLSPWNWVPFQHSIKGLDSKDRSLALTLPRSIPQENVSNSRDQKQEHSSSSTSAAADQFAPRFDGLRFIETLVTAHRWYRADPYQECAPFRESGDIVEAVKLIIRCCSQFA